MYQKFVIGESNAHVRVLDMCVQKNVTAKETVDTRIDVIRPDRIIICSDWSATLRCGITFGYKNGDGIGCGRRPPTKGVTVRENRAIIVE